MAKAVPSELQIDKHNLEVLFDRAPALIAIFEGPNGVVRLFNKLFQQLWGNRTVIGLPMRDAWPELEGQNYFELIDLVYKTGEKVEVSEYPGRIDRHNNGQLEQAFFNFVAQPYKDTKNKTIGVMVHGFEVTKQVIARQDAELVSEHLTLALRSSEMGTWEWDIPTNTLTWSDELKTVFGMKPDDPVNYDQYLSMLHPDDRAKSQAIIKKAMKSGRPYRFEHRITWPDGSEHWIVGMGQAFLKDGIAVRMIGTSKNIDDRREAEETLRQQNDYLETLHSTAVEASRGFKDVTQMLQVILERASKISDTKHGYIYLADPESNQMTVRVATGIFKAHLGHSINRGEGLAGRVWQSGEPLVVDDYDKWKGRQENFPKSLFFAAVAIPLRVNKQTIGVIALTHVQEGLQFDQEEITALSRLADLASIALYNASLFKDLQQSEQRFRSIADTAPILIWETGLTRECTYFNKGWLNFTGRTLEQELGNGWLEGMHPDDRERCEEVFIKATDLLLPINTEYRLRRYDGQYRWVLDSGVPRYNSDDVFIGYIGSCVDVEDFKRSQALERQAANLTRERSQLMTLNRAKDDFISLASHQLRTPATGVKQYIGLLLEGYGGGLSPRQVKLLKTAFDSNERQLTIINDLLKVAHADAGKIIIKKADADIAAVVRDVVREQMSTFVKRQQKIVLDVTREPVIVYVDADRVRMVIENLVDNASKYTPEGKSITVSLRNLKKQVSIDVKDTGVGIADKDRKKLFHKFSRVNNVLSTSSGGTGLGLYWAKKIVDLHDGKINIESKLGEGSTFTICLPKEVL